MHSEQIKKIAIKLYYKFNSYRKVASILEISKSIIHYWINYEYVSIKNNTNDINKITKFIKEALINDSYITTIKLKHSLFSKKGITVSKSLIYNIIVNKLNYSYKKVSNKMYNKNITNLLKQKKIFKKAHKKYKNIICIDETYVHSNIFYKYGWSPKGNRLIHYSKTNPIKYSIIVAISRNKIEHHLIKSQNINKISYKQFIEHLCLTHKNKKFLMDNVSFHKSKEILEIIKKSSNEAIFIPPYSPELNPIEEVFSLFKRKLRDTNTSEPIIDRIQKTINNLLNVNFENYYKHSFVE